MLSPKAASARSTFIAIAHGLAGWALCGVVMEVGMKVTTAERTLVVHAVAAPVIFAAISLVYFHRRDSWPPLLAAAVILGVVAAMDVFVVALLVERSLAMFGSILGTWLPFLLIFLSTWLTGVAVRRPGRGKAG